MSNKSTIAHSNTHKATVEGFGQEWARFNFEGQNPALLDRMFESYFSVFPWATLPPNACGFDAGCGSGRWAERVAPRVGHLHCVDASAVALNVARNKLRGVPNCSFHHGSVANIPFPDNSMDFGFSLGVLHHTPDPLEAMRSCVAKLKPGAPFLVYLYYSLDNRSGWYRAIWRATDLVRLGVSRLPDGARYAASQLIAATVYWPLAKSAEAVERVGLDPSQIPLATYRDKDFYVMRNDALDRFGTQTEHRFSRSEIEAMMHSAGLENVRFRESEPYWCAVGFKVSGASRVSKG